MINKKCADVSICGFLKFSHAGNFRQQHQLLHEQLLNNEDFINLIFSQKDWAKDAELEAWYGNTSIDVRRYADCDFQKIDLFWRMNLTAY